MQEASLFAQKLRQWRAQNGKAGRMTQDELASILDVSVDAIGKYERSLSYIRGDFEPRLAERLGWSRDEIIACREDWTARQGSAAGPRYRLLDQSVVDEVYGGSWSEVAMASLRLAQEQFHDLPASLAPNVDVFQPFYTHFRDLWSAVFAGDEMVAKWGMTVLLPEDEDRFRAGLFEESDLSVDRVRSTMLPGTYYGYCPVLIVKPGEENAASLLLSSFVGFLEKLADRGALFHGIGTVSVSPAGAQVCRDFGMDRIGVHCADPSFELWNMSGETISRSIFARKSPRVAEAYRARFPADKPSRTG